MGAVGLALVPSLAGAVSLSTGNGRAEERDRPVVLPGEALTEARLVQLTLGEALDRGELAVDLGMITAEAARAGGLFSELLIEGVRVGEESFPTIAYHSDGDEIAQENEDLTITVKDNFVESTLALANWHLKSSPAGGAVSRLDLLSGTVGVPGVGFKVNMGERGFAGEVTPALASARFAITLEDLRVTLDSLLPDTMLPLGTSLDLVTRLQLPLGDQLAPSVARVVRLMQDLAVIEDTLGDIDDARGVLDDLAEGSPAVRAALQAVEQAEAAAARAAADLTSAGAQVDAARMAANTTDAAADAAESAVAAARQDVASAQATVNSLQSQVDALNADIAALQAELGSTLNPVRLAQIPGEIVAKQTVRAGVLVNLSSAQTALAGAKSVLAAAETSAVAKRGAADAAQATLAAAESAKSAAATSVHNAQAAVTAAQSGADAALAAAAVSNAAVATAAEEYDQLKDRLQTLLQGLSDLLDAIPELPVLEQDLDEALRAADMLSIGGLALETVVEADRDGSRNLVHCKVHDVVVLGYRPQIEECVDLIAMEKEAVRRVNEVLHGLGAVGVDGVQLLGPGGTWSEPGPVGPDGVARSQGQMSALTFVVPEVNLGGVAANALAKLGPVLELIQQRPVSRIALPVITPDIGGVVKLGAGRMTAVALPSPSTDAETQTLGEQIQQVSDEADTLADPATLQNLSTGSVKLIVAQARTTAEYDTTRLDDADVSDPTEVCGGDPVCLAQCAAGRCPGAAGENPTGADGPGAGGPGSTPGSGSDSVNLPLPGDVTSAKLPMTGPAGGLTALALLGLGTLGAQWMRRRPVS